MKLTFYSDEDKGFAINNDMDYFRSANYWLSIHMVWEWSTIVNGDLPFQVLNFTIFINVV